MTLRMLMILSCLTLFPTAAHAADPDLPRPTIQEWDVPWENTRPRDPYVGPDGNVWFVGQRGHYVAELDPANGEFRRIDLDDGTGPHNLIVAADGTIYYAGNRAAHIGRLDPDSGAIDKIPMPDERARDPHTLVFDAAGDIFFTVQGGNMVGRLNAAREVVQLTTVPTGNARPYGIVIAPSARSGRPRSAPTSSSRSTPRPWRSPRSSCRAKGHGHGACSPPAMAASGTWTTPRGCSASCTRQPTCSRSIPFPAAAKAGPTAWR